MSETQNQPTDGRECVTCKKTVEDGVTFREVSHNPGTYRRKCRNCENDDVQIKRRAKNGNPATVKKVNKPRVPKKIGRTRVKLHRAEEAVRLLKRENKTLAHELSDTLARHAFIEDYLKPTSPTIYIPKESKKRPATAVVMFSDWHVEERVEAEKVLFGNEYSPEIADMRIEKALEGLLWLLEGHSYNHHIEELVLWLGGDLITGYIHEELEESNFMSPPEAIMWLHPRLIGFLDAVAELDSLRSIRVPCTPGNHGRTTKRKRYSTAAENSYEWMLYQNLASHYATHEKINIRAPRSSMLYENIGPYTIRFIHGDEINYRDGIGGITIPLFKKMHRWDKQRQADVTCMGHYHQYISVPKAVGNGSLIGYSPFALKFGFEFEDPQQAFFLMDHERGKCQCTPIWCKSKKERIAL